MDRKPALVLEDGVSVRLTDSGDYVYMLDGSRDICMSLVDARKLADWIYAQSPGEPGEKLPPLPSGSDFNADLVQVNCIRQGAESDTYGPLGQRDITFLLSFIDNLWKAYTAEAKKARGE